MGDVSAEPASDAEIECMAFTIRRWAEFRGVPLSAVLAKLTGFQAELVVNGLRFQTPDVWREALEAISKSEVSPACARIAKAALAAEGGWNYVRPDLSVAEWKAQYLQQWPEPPERES